NSDIVKVFAAAAGDVGRINNRLCQWAELGDKPILVCLDIGAVCARRHGEVGGAGVTCHIDIAHRVDSDAPSLGVGVLVARPWYYPTEVMLETDLRGVAI